MYSTQNFRLYLTVIVTKLDFNNQVDHGIGSDPENMFVHVVDWRGRSVNRSAVNK